MLEMDCVVNGLRHEFEVGETDDQMVAFFKSKKSIKEIIEKLECNLARFNITVEILKTKEDANGNVVMIKMHYMGGW